MQIRQSYVLSFCIRLLIIWSKVDLIIRSLKTIWSKSRSIVTWHPYPGHKCDYQSGSHQKFMKLNQTIRSRIQPYIVYCAQCRVSIKWGYPKSLYLDAFQYLSLEYQKVSQSVNAPLLPNIQRGIHVLKR